MKNLLFVGLFLILACQPVTQSAEASQVSTIEATESTPSRDLPMEVEPSLEQEEGIEPQLPTERIKKPIEKEETRAESKPVQEKANSVKSIEEVNLVKEEGKSSTPADKEIIPQPKEEEAEVVSQVEELAGSISHTIWNTLLVKNVSASGKVNYKGFISSKADLQQYLDLLSANPPASSWPKNERLAYWINAYNAFTVKLIIDNYPLKSIMDLDQGKPWDKAFIKIGGKSYSLNNIEHDIIRKQFNEPRIHFAVNCASISCPKLLNEAYTAEKLPGQLNKQTRAYINNPQENRLSVNSAEISSLFDWYKADFTKAGSLTDFINTYSKVQINPSASISFKNYNWALNE